MAPVWDEPDMLASSTVVLESDEATTVAELLSRADTRRRLDAIATERGLDLRDITDTDRLLAICQEGDELSPTVLLQTLTGDPEAMATSADTVEDLRSAMVARAVVRSVIAEFEMLALEIAYGALRHDDPYLRFYSEGEPIPDEIYFYATYRAPDGPDSLHLACRWPLSSLPKGVKQPAAKQDSDCFTPALCAAVHPWLLEEIAIQVPEVARAWTSGEFR